MQDIIVYIIVACATIYAVTRFWKHTAGASKRGSGCCNCGNDCPMSKEMKKKRRKLC